MAFAEAVAKTPDYLSMCRAGDRDLYKAIIDREYDLMQAGSLNVLHIDFYFSSKASYDTLHFIGYNLFPA